jgi:preprotein translocase subunit YajC
MDAKTFNDTLLLILEGQPGTLTLLLPYILVFVIIYLLIIRPHQKRQKQAQKEREDLIASLKVGDKVITSGGIFGTIAAARENTVTLRIADKVQIEVLRSAIAGPQSADIKEVKETEAVK